MKIRNRFLTTVLGWCLYASLRILFATVRKRFHVVAPDTLAYIPEPNGRYLFCTWHDSILLPLFMGRPHHMAALVSQHRDGEYLTDLMAKLRILCVRGSSTKGGVEALRESMQVAQHRHITITPDGPRGPRRKMKEGIVFLASKAGRPIVPMAFHCERSWTIKGRWTDLVVPKPFSIVHMVLAHPIEVPRKVSRDELSVHSAMLQEKIDEAYASAEQHAKTNLRLLNDRSRPSEKQTSTNPEDRRAA